MDLHLANVVNLYTILGTIKSPLDLTGHLTCFKCKYDLMIHLYHMFYSCKTYGVMCLLFKVGCMKFILCKWDLFIYHIK